MTGSVCVGDFSLASASSGPSSGIKPPLLNLNALHQQQQNANAAAGGHGVNGTGSVALNSSRAGSTTNASIRQHSAAVAASGGSSSAGAGPSSGSGSAALAAGYFVSPRGKRSAIPPGYVTPRTGASTSATVQVSRRLIEGYGIRICTPSGLSPTCCCIAARVAEQRLTLLETSGYFLSCTDR